MASTVRIRRARGDAPVDLLYVAGPGDQQQQHDTASAVYYCRMPSTEVQPGYVQTVTPQIVGRKAARSTHQPRDAFGVPIVRSTVSSGERSNMALPSLLSSSPSPSPWRDSLAHARHFHLTRPASTPKRKRGLEDTLVFVEKKRSKTQHDSRTPNQHGDHRQTHQAMDLVDSQLATPPTSSDIDNMTGIEVSGRSSSPPLKRPNCNATERRWRQETRRHIASKSGASSASRPSTSSSAKSQPDPSLDAGMVDMMLKFALEVEAAETPTRVSSSTVQALNESNQALSTREPPRRKATPRPAALRHRSLNADEERSRHDSMETDSTGSHDSSANKEYVFDTYVRLTQAPPLADLTSTIGALVIEEDEQELWQTYAYDASDEEYDYNSDEDDENAENYYGADYPEEEVDSADEFDRDPYSFRRGAGDQEEYDKNDAAFSDDDNDLGISLYPWQKTDEDGD